MHSCHTSKYEYLKHLKGRRTLILFWLWQAIDGIYHMLRGFESKDITHVDGRVDPIEDLKCIHHELLLKDIERISNVIDGNRKNIERGVGGKEKKAEFVSHPTQASTRLH
jgi:ribosome-binding ATPase YchF (GTP1/OBG family)